ncbi:MAG: hypothetical protein OEZ02_06995 [Anaerolineae bacterium]|nr:hypothetical protein [Anaerolineae bacterium]
MKTARVYRFLIVGLTLLAAGLACSIPKAGDKNLGEASATAPAGEDARTPEGGEAATPQPGGDAVVPSETPRPTVMHVTTPSSPTVTNSFVTDRSSKSLASEKRANADNFEINLYERPFTAQDMDYQDYLDITRAEISLGSPWLYVTILVEGAPPQGSSAAYAVEIDLDMDGRGDRFITGIVPDGTDWTTDGVQVYRDFNQDVGGVKVMRVDAPHPGRDGYEDLLFDQGLGADPDTAWIRRDPSNPKQVQLAFKHAIIEGLNKFMWGVWADEGVKQPGWLDYHDHFTLAEAGSPASNSSEYPLKAMASVDNTCRWSYGFELTGTEPGACYIPPTPTPIPPTATPAPVSIYGGVFNDYGVAGKANNGIKDAGEFGRPNQTIKLGEGACASTGYASTTTASDGSFSFTNLPAGKYCVTWQFTPSCSAWASTPIYYTVSLSSGQSKTLNWFGFVNAPCKTTRNIIWGLLDALLPPRLIVW